MEKNVLHISLDDTKGIFKALSKNCIESIFETRTLSYLKELNQKYGVCFYLFCTCVDDFYSLENVSDKYKNEFLINQDWLKFGFHCYREDLPYVARSCEEFIGYYKYFDYHIRRITGHKSNVHALRIHGFQGTEDMCRYLVKEGIDTLFTADDERNSYYLNNEIARYLQNNGIYFDSKFKIKFVKSCVRLENCDDILLELDKRKKDRQYFISVFTHEWQMDKKEIRRKLEICCKWGVENNGA